MNRILRPAFPRVTWHAALCLAVAVPAAAWIYVFVPTYFPGGDATGYHDFAIWLSFQSGGGYLPWRSPGTSLFQVFTLVTTLNTFKIYNFVCFAMAIAMPLLVYGMLAPAQRTLATAIAVAICAGGVPYVYQTYLLSEHPYMFLQLLALFLFARHYAAPSGPATLYLIAVVCVALQLTRATGGVFFWVFLAVALLDRRTRSPHLLGAALLVVSLNGAHLAIDRIAGTSQMPMFFTTYAQGERRFIERYLGEREPSHVFAADSNPSIAAANGPATALLAEHVREHVAKTRAAWAADPERYPVALFANRASGSDADFAREILARGNAIYYAFVKAAIDAKLDRPGANALFGAVAQEHGTAGTAGWLNFYRARAGALFLGHTPVAAGRQAFGFFFAAPFRVAAGRTMATVPGYEKLRAEFVDSRPFGPEVEELFVRLRDPRGAVLFDRANGPASAEIDAAIRFTLAHGRVIERSPAMAEFASDVDGLVDLFFGGRAPASVFAFEGLFWTYLAQFYGFKKTDALLAAAARETLAARPRAAFMMLDNLLRITFARPYADTAATGTPILDPGLMVWSFVADSTEWVFDPGRKNAVEGLRPGLRSEFVAEIPDTPTIRFLALSHALYLGLVPLALLLALPLYLLGFLTRLWQFQLVLGLLYGAQSLAFAMFGQLSHHRYDYVVSIYPILMAALGAAGLAAFVRAFWSGRAAARIGSDEGTKR